MTQQTAPQETTYSTEERRREIVRLLKQANAPLTGTTLADHFGVSRQVIVQDIAVLRAAGEEIHASPRGYYMHPPGRTVWRSVVAVRHTPEQTEDELLALVDVGVEVVDVIVEHPIYGELRGNLHIASRADVAQFMQQLRETKAHLLSELTDGLHLHTLEARTNEALVRAREVLREKGYLVE
ncbi:hypothetical protein ARMA_2186 [Ardenticatena maritima]|uniref:Transcription repressor NadR n=1 Tax=Ardenticatena maritima TaxID=872965 RepID=A0A0M8K847_9CHLR|nr:transcription repressor NadR [Ardenticatena maritima]KPL88549.1 hypothetical protein SE16_07195 [Ardenticatena maritima]GAP63763.1 hypothetical protein ARMA_2186 [Ardenticatena maritima]